MHPLYVLGCEARDTQHDFLLAEKNFLDSNSFEGMYALAELYQHGASSIYSEDKNNQIKQDLAKATEYFIKAYELNRDKFIIEPTALNASAIHNLQDSNELLQQANEFNPEALYQLACFYRQEHQYIVEGEPTKRIITANAAELTSRIKACLQVAADLYHPRAAFLHSTAYADDLTTEQKLKYSLIAADPETAMERFISSPIDQITYRGNYEIKTNLRLSSAEELPLVLRSQRSISVGRVKGFSEQSTTYYGTSILPTAHQQYDSQQVNTLGGMAQTIHSQDRESLRARRMKFFGLQPAGEIRPIDNTGLKTAPK